MNFEKISLISAFLVVFISLSAFANEELLNCNSNNFITKTDCSVTEKELATASDFQMTYEVKYLYVCKGHSVVIGVESESKFHTFHRGSVSQTLYVNAREYLKVTTPEPNKVRQAIFSSDCTLKVTDVKKLPHFLL